MSTKEIIYNISFKSKLAIDKIKNFSKLEENWDSYGAIVPTVVAIKNAINFIKRADEDKLEVYFTVPGRNGEVLVEYRLSDSISCEIYFNSDGTNELLIFNGDECLVEGTIEDNYYDLNFYRDEFRK